MNPLNYCTREAAQRLVDAGIVLETEKCWYLSGDDNWYLVESGKYPHIKDRYPAPSPAEVWRKLPEVVPNGEVNWNVLSLRKYGDITVCNYSNAAHSRNLNLTDALIDLLIWVKEKK